MNVSLLRFYLGNVLSSEALLMLLPFAVSVIYREPEKYIFLIVGAVLMLIGRLLAAHKPQRARLEPRDGFFAVAMCWVALALAGALPFYFSGYFASYIDCFFEAVSGFTTTGASILPAVEPLPRGILFWRSLMHWVGGMGVLVFVLALIPTMDGSSVQLMRAESPGPDPGKLSPRLRDTAQSLYRIYLIMTVVTIGALVLTGMPVFDSLIHAMGAAGTGGFSCLNGSVGQYGNLASEVVLTIACFLFGVNFTLYYYVTKGKWRDAVGNLEFKVYTGVVLVATALIALNTIGFYNGSIGQALRHASFQVVTIITTTGYSSTNFDLWPTFSKTILMLLMLVGACAGSTGGGMKVIRLTTLFKGLKQEVGRILHPRRVTRVRMDGNVVEEGVLRNILLFFFIYIVILFGACLVIAVDGFDFTTNMSACLSALGNIGPGLGAVGPMSNFSAYSGFSKLVLSFCMLAGRLEIFPMLMLFSPAMWRRRVL
mgnify:CR=1 FL=1